MFLSTDTQNLVLEAYCLWPMLGTNQLASWIPVITNVWGHRMFVLAVASRKLEPKLVPKIPTRDKDELLKAG